MSETLTQIDVEQRMYLGGIKRMQKSMDDAEASGNAGRNPYAATVMRDFVLPLAALLKSDADAPIAGRRKAHAQLLLALDFDAVAYLAVRTVLTRMMSLPVPSMRMLGYAVGAAVHCELVLAQIQHLNPDMYHTLAKDLGRRLSKDVRHRMTVFKMQAAKLGLPVVEWPIGAREQVGLYLLDLLARLGMVEIDSPPMKDGKQLAVGRNPTLGVRLNDHVLDTISQIKEFVSITAPVYGPCVEPPLDWTRFDDGGFHTPEMRRVHPYLVKAPSASRELLKSHLMPTVLRAANALQRTAWAVNTRVLDAVYKVAQDLNLGEIVTVRETGKPVPPVWLKEMTDKSDLSPAQTQEFKDWKRSMADWYTERKLMGARYGRFYSATRCAEMFREAPALHFVYFADSRGRFYPLTYGVNPQGSDMQKALLHFAQGKPLHTEAAVKWFLIQGANKWGFDKASLEDRAAWAKPRHQQLMAMASDPANNRDWADCDNPLQFLAWVFEYADWCIDPQGFESRLPVSMDGSCNGLQNFSAMLRDEVGGRATNLVPNAVMEDIYKRVAEAATLRMKLEPELDEFMVKWLELGIDRSVVKRAVMTTPYGVTKRSAVNYVMEDYLKKGKAPCFDPKDYLKAAAALIKFVWLAIGDVVVKSREAMDWLKACARAIIKEHGDEREGVISWITPSGFLATQAYYEVEEHRIHTRVHGTTRIKVLAETDEADSSRHCSGMAPNFVHSMDASHLHLTVDAAATAGIDALAMIHDDFGTHAADAQQLFDIIRQQFVKMYEDNDPIEEFKTAYPCCPTPPTKGNLDIREVLQSDYFFS